MWFSKNRRRLPVSVRVTAWYTFFIAGLLIIMGVVSFFLAGRFMADISKRDLAEAVGEMAADPSDFESFDDGIFFILYDSEGRPLSGSAPHGFDISTPFGSSSVRSYESGSDAFYYYDLPLSGSGPGWVRGVIPLGGSGAGWIFLIFAGLSPVLLIIIVYGGYRIIKAAFLPVRRIAYTAEEIRESRDFSKRIPTDGSSDEIGKMAEVFNRMLDALEASFLHEKRFNSDVSHELRTPCSVILAESEYGLRHAETLEEARESLTVIQRQSRRISMLIDQIMALARLEQSRGETFETMNLSEVLNRSLRDSQSLFQDRGIRLETQIREGLRIYGDHLMIERLFDNLLSNAIKFTADTVSVSLERDGASCVLTVRDNGPGISEADRQMIWERFYQTDASRNRDQNQGSGLGLSMVAQIVRLHRAAAEVESAPGQGSAFVIRWPAAAPPADSA